MLAVDKLNHRGMERQCGPEFEEPICDGEVTTRVLNGVINRPEVVMFCGACFNNSGKFNT